jgi:hypothetical protein
MILKNTGGAEMPIEETPAGEQIPFVPRRHLRYDFVHPIEYVRSHTATDDISQGIIINISNSGMCLYTNCILCKGQEIKITSILPSNSQTAVVRWAEKIDASRYRIGLEFQ